MKLSRPVTEVIRARSSRRKYQPRPIAAEARGVLQRWLAPAPAGPFCSATRFELIAATEQDQSALKGLGTYGFIKDAPGFIVGAVARGDRDMEDFGYIMEQAILLATDLDLGTCWLGGTFNRSTFADRISVTGDETVPAVVAVGHASERRGAVEQLIRWGAKARQRLPWERLFFTGKLGTPLTSEAAGRYATVLEMVRIGPSASNRQPWRLVREASGERYHLLLERTPGYGKDSKLFDLPDLQRIDMGIAMCHFELAAGELGIPGRWVAAESPLQEFPELTEPIATWVEQ